MLFLWTSKITSEKDKKKKLPIPLFPKLVPSTKLIGLDNLNIVISKLTTSNLKSVLTDAGAPGSLIFNTTLSVKFKGRDPF
jgi:hypothetical protein